MVKQLKQLKQFKYLKQFKHLKQIEILKYQIRVNISLQTPRSPKEWQGVADGFEARWQFPNCVGCVDGKHIRIKVPPRVGVHYHNYKGFASVVLLGVVDSDYSFLYVDVGKPGRCADGGVWRDCDFNKVRQLVNGMILILL